MSSDDVEISYTEIFDGLRKVQENFVSANMQNSDPIVVTWDRVKLETQKNVHMMNLCTMIQSVFPLEKREMPPTVDGLLGYPRQLVYY